MQKSSDFRVRRGFCFSLIENFTVASIQNCPGAPGQDFPDSSGLSGATKSQDGLL